MGNNGFSIEEAIKFGWQQTKKFIWFFAGVILVLGIVAVILSVVQNMAQADQNLSILVGLINGFFQLMIGMGLIKITLTVCENKTPDIFDFFAVFPLILKYLAAYILYLLIVFTGTILLIVPGIIWAIQFIFYPYLIIDKNLGPIAALKKSSELTKGVKVQLFLFGIAITVINFLGALCLLVGLFVTIPITAIAYACIYKTLLARTENSQGPDNVSASA